jgi:hypothetical protein
MKVEAAAKTGHMMTDLGISEERCRVLCGLIQKTIIANPRQKPIEVIEKASKHALDESEVRFLFFTLGKYVKDPLEIALEQIEEHLFSSIMRDREQYMQQN